MSNLKLTIAAVLIFNSSTIFAGTMGFDCTPGRVTVPCVKEAWNVGVQALYLRAVYSDGFSYSGLRSTPLFVTVGGIKQLVSLDSEFEQPSAQWGGGFELELSYHFSTGSDLDFNWYHNKTTKDSGSFLSTDFFARGIFLDFAVDDRLKSVWDAVNMEFGQQVDLGEDKKIRFYAGAQYVRVERYEDTILRFVGVNNVLALIDTPLAVSGSRHEFYGFGPRTGIDLSYHWANGFAIYGKTAAALLLGSSKFSEATLFVPNGSVFLLSYGGSKTAIIPELEVKLGAKYERAMKHGDLTLDAGYMWVNYFHAIHGFTAANLGILHESNFSLNGPYLGLKWVDYF